MVAEDAAVIPDERLSTEVVPAVFVHDEPEDYDPLVDVEPGGVALNDPSEGLFGVLWTLRCEDGHSLLISSPDVAETTLFTRDGTVTELSLAFDQNMRPTVAFVEDDQAYLYWYDSVEESAVFTALASDVVNPRVTLDDKRELQRGASDVILAYLRSGSLYFRAQRDRYEVEYLLKSGITDRQLEKVAMNVGLRLQFQLGVI